MNSEYGWSQIYKRSPITEHNTVPPTERLALENAQFVGQIEEMQGCASHWHQVANSNWHVHLTKGLMNLDVVGTFGQWTRIVSANFRANSCSLLHCNLGCNEAQEWWSQVQADQQFHKKAYSHSTNLKWEGNIWGSHSNEYEDGNLLGYSIM